MEIELRESAAKVTALESQLQLAAEREKDMKLEARKREDEFSAVDGEAAQARNDVHALNLELDQTKARTKSKEAEALRKQEGLEKRGE